MAGETTTRLRPASGRFLLAAGLVFVVDAASGQQSDRRAAIEPLRDFSVRLTSPSPDKIVAGRVRLAAEVTADRLDEVLFVEFSVDGRVLFSDATRPYEMIWRSDEIAGHRIVARAFGPAGEVVEDQVETEAPPAIDAARSFSSRVERVEMYVHVEGRGSLGLEIDDFVVVENGVEQSIVEIERSQDLPVAVGFMVDCSGSMVERLSFVLETAGAFIGGLMRQQHDKAFVMSFADLPALLQEFTDDVGRLSMALDLIDSGRYTRLYDSVVMAAREFRGHTGRKAVVLLTDGRDANSDARLDDAIRAAQRADVAIYPVAVGVTSRFFYERWVLERLARATGGRVFHMQRLDDPRPTYERISEDLRQQYRIAYEPHEPGGDGEWRTVEVRLAAGSRGKVRARPGYYAQ